MPRLEARLGKVFTTANISRLASAMVAPPSTARCCTSRVHYLHIYSILYIKISTVFCRYFGVKAVSTWTGNISGMYMKGMEQSPMGAAVMKTSTQERGSQLGAAGVRPELPGIRMSVVLVTARDYTESQQRHSHHCGRCDQNSLPWEIFHNGQKQQ